MYGSRFATPLAALLLVAMTPVPAADVLLENVTIVSPELEQPLPGRWLLIRGERIAQVSDRPIAAPNAQRIAGRGRYLTPGLMDSHVHLTMPPGLMDSHMHVTLPPGVQLTFDDQAVRPLLDAYTRQQPRSYLYFGVTQVLDLLQIVAPPGIKLSIDTFEAQPQHPDVFRCGAAPALDGYPTVFFDKPTRYALMPDYIFEPANAAKHPFPGQPGVPPPIAEHLRRVHASGTGFQPTLRVLPGMANLFRPDTLADPMYAKVVPASLLKWYATEAGQWYRRSMDAEYQKMPPEKITSMLSWLGEHGVRATGYLHELGHPLLLGSDTPSAPTYGHQPGYDTYREMLLMAQSGVSLPAILRAATLNNARQFGLVKDYGTVAAGKIANLLLLTENPLETVRAWNSIDNVILRGEVIEREKLSAAAL